MKLLKMISIIIALAIAAMVAFSAFPNIGLAGIAEKLSHSYTPISEEEQVHWRDITRDILVKEGMEAHLELEMNVLGTRDDGAVSVSINNPTPLDTTNSLLISIHSNDAAGKWIESGQTSYQYEIQTLVF